MAADAGQRISSSGEDYVYLAPFVENEDAVLLKITLSHKATKPYLGETVRMERRVDHERIGGEQAAAKRRDSLRTPTTDNARHLHGAAASQPDSPGGSRPGLGRVRIFPRSIPSAERAAAHFAGIVLAACRYLDASVEQIDLPLGFGSRHLAAASISYRLGAIAIVVSESGVVRVFHGGQIEATLIPELWLLDRHHTQLSVAAAGAVEAQRLGAATFSLSEAGREP